MEVSYIGKIIATDYDQVFRPQTNGKEQENMRTLKDKGGNRVAQGHAAIS